MNILKKQKAIDIFEKYLNCSNNSADMCSSIGCKNCEYDVTGEEFDKAVNTAIFYLKELIRDETECERETITKGDIDDSKRIPRKF